MAYTEVLTGHDITAEQFDDMCHREYTRQLFMKFLMGTSENSVIQVKENLAKKAGDAVTVNYKTTQAGGTVRGNAKGVGNEGSIGFYGQRVTIDNVRTLHKIWDVPMTQKRTTFDILTEAKDSLTTKHAETLDDDIINVLCSDATGRVRGRYLYGAADSNWNATHTSALTAVDATNDMLTGAMIGVAKRKATLLGTGVTEKIRPMRVVNGQASEQWYMFLGHTYSIRDLVNSDAVFRNVQLLLPPRSNADSIFFSGSAFKGSFEGVLIYEYEAMPLVSSTIQVAHNLLLGAQAGVVCWGQRTKFGEEEEDLAHNLIYELHDIRGQAKMVRNSVDHGLVNVFAAAVAD